mmetsp:Transcript_57153/g.162260  ORF Transcript_57153/g.162260 Transcript_57153/m.162260 type:complete len:449 (+) Transcript_57153:61-1407(+)
MRHAGVFWCNFAAVVCIAASLGLQRPPSQQKPTASDNETLISSPHKAEKQPKRPRARRTALHGVVLLLQGIRADHKELVDRVYDGIFRRIVYIAWKWPSAITSLNREQAPTSVLGGPSMETERERAEESRTEFVDDEEVRKLQAMVEPKPGYEQVSPGLYVCHARKLYQWTCLVPILRDLAASRERVSGVLSCHVDFWFHPLGILGRRDNLDKIWWLDRGWGPVDRKWPFCLSDYASLMKDTRWHWLNSKQQSWDAFQAAAQNLSFSGEVQVCGAWSDLFYLPRGAWSDFALAAEPFRDVGHEVALPTIFRLLERAGRARLREPLACAGGCCRNTSLRELRGRACGHKLWLSDGALTRDWESMMQNRSSCMWRRQVNDRSDPDCFEAAKAKGAVRDGREQGAPRAPPGAVTRAGRQPGQGTGGTRKTPQRPEAARRDHRTSVSGRMAG